MAASQSPSASQRAFARGRQASVRALSASVKRLTQPSPPPEYAAGVRSMSTRLAVIEIRHAGGGRQTLSGSGPDANSLLTISQSPSVPLRRWNQFENANRPKNPVSSTRTLAAFPTTSTEVVSAT